MNSRQRTRCASLIHTRRFGLRRTCCRTGSKAGAVYFITFRLADALPARLLAQREDERTTWLRFHPKPWTLETEDEYHKRFSGAVERWPDAGHGSCLLRQIDCAKIIDDALRHFDGKRLALISSVVMPNHVHLLLVQNPEYPLEDLLRSWKTFSARAINEVRKRSGTLWQRSYFDRLVRDEKHFRNCLRYIRKNPEKAHLRNGKYILYESDLAKKIQGTTAS